MEEFRPLQRGFLHQRFCETLKPLKIDPMTKKFPIFVTEIETKTRFWFHRKGRNYHQALNLVNADMYDFYTRSIGVNQDINLEIDQIRIGLPVAAQYGNSGYNRGVVREVNIDGTVKIFFCDYGTLCDVKIDDVFRLCYQFGALEMQAFPARLWGVAEDPTDDAGFNRIFEIFTNNVKGYTAKIKVGFREGDLQTPIPVCLTSLDNNKNINKEIERESISTLTTEQMRNYEVEEDLYIELELFATLASKCRPEEDVYRYFTSKHAEVKDKILDQMGDWARKEQSEDSSEMNLPRGAMESLAKRPLSLDLALPQKMKDDIQKPFWKEWVIVGPGKLTNDTEIERGLTSSEGQMEVSIEQAKNEEHEENEEVGDADTSHNKNSSDIVLSKLFNSLEIRRLLGEEDNEAITRPEISNNMSLRDSVIKKMKEIKRENESKKCLSAEGFSQILTPKKVEDSSDQMKIKDVKEIDFIVQNQIRSGKQSILCESPRGGMKKVQKKRDDHESKQKVSFTGTDPILQRSGEQLQIVAGNMLISSSEKSATSKVASEDFQGQNMPLMKPKESPIVVDQEAASLPPIDSEANKQILKETNSSEESPITGKPSHNVIETDENHTENKASVVTAADSDKDEKSYTVLCKKGVATARYRSSLGQPAISVEQNAADQTSKLADKIASPTDEHITFAEQGAELEKENSKTISLDSETSEQAPVSKHDDDLRLDGSKSVKNMTDDVPREQVRGPAKQNDQSNEKSQLSNGCNRLSSVTDEKSLKITANNALPSGAGEGSEFKNKLEPNSPVKGSGSHGRDETRPENTHRHRSISSSKLLSSDSNKTVSRSPHWSWNQSNQRSTHDESRKWSNTPSRIWPNSNRRSSNGQDSVNSRRTNARSNNNSRSKSRGRQARANSPLGNWPNSNSRSSNGQDSVNSRRANAQSYNNSRSKYQATISTAPNNNSVRKSDFYNNRSSGGSNMKNNLTNQSGQNNVSRDPPKKERSGDQHLPICSSKHQPGLDNQLERELEDNSQSVDKKLSDTLNTDNNNGSQTSTKSEQTSSKPINPKTPISLCSKPDPETKSIELEQSAHGSQTQLRSNCGSSDIGSNFGGVSAHLRAQATTPFSLVVPPEQVSGVDSSTATVSVLTEPGPMTPLSPNQSVSSGMRPNIGVSVQFAPRTTSPCPVLVGPALNSTPVSGVARAFPLPSPLSCSPIPDQNRPLPPAMPPVYSYPPPTTYYFCPQNIPYLPCNSVVRSSRSYDYDYEGYRLLQNERNERDTKTIESLCLQQKELVDAFDKLRQEIKELKNRERVVNLEREKLSSFINSELVSKLASLSLIASIDDSTRDLTESKDMKEIKSSIFDDTTEIVRGKQEPMGKTCYPHELTSYCHRDDLSVPNSCNRDDVPESVSQCVIEEVQNAGRNDNIIKQQAHSNEASTRKIRKMSDSAFGSSVDSEAGFKGSSSTNSKTAPSNLQKSVKVYLDANRVPKTPRLEFLELEPGWLLPVLIGWGGRWIHSRHASLFIRNWSRSDLLDRLLRVQGIHLEKLPVKPEDEDLSNFYNKLKPIDDGLKRARHLYSLYDLPVVIHLFVKDQKEQQYLTSLLDPFLQRS